MYSKNILKLLYKIFQQSEVFFSEYTLNEIYSVSTNKTEFQIRKSHRINIEILKRKQYFI